MQFVFFIVILLLLAVAIFAFQNPDPVTVRFLVWRTSSSLAIVGLAATAGGALRELERPPAHVIALRP